MAKFWSVWVYCCQRVFILLKLNLSFFRYLFVCVCIWQWPKGKTGFIANDKKIMYRRKPNYQPNIASSQFCTVNKSDGKRKHRIESNSKL